MLIDLGGTSTELSAGRGGVIDDCIDIGFGTHHLALPHRMKGSRLLVRSIRRRFLSSGGGGIFSGDGIGPGAFDQESGDHSLVLLTGGTAVTLGMIDDLSRGLAPDPGRDSRMDTNLLETLFRRLMELPAMRWPRLLPVTPRRANLLPAGIVLLKFILEWLNINMFTVTARDLRWGIILSGGEVAGRYIFDEQKSSDS
jgi:exopolyphosphatase/pppGpp-phosphohydrolase